MSIGFVILVAWYVNRIRNEQAEDFIFGTTNQPKSTSIPGSGQFFDKIASTYDLLNGMISLGYHSQWRQTAISKILPCNTLLDVATGTADIPLTLSKIHPHIKITGLDPSTEMLSIARKKVSSNVNLVQGVAEDLRFENESFDSVIVSFGVRNFKNRQLGLNEISRVIVRNGKFAVLEISTPVKTNGFLFTISRVVIKYGLVPLAGFISGDNFAYSYLLKSMDGFPKREEFENMLRAAGFTVDEYHRLPPLGFGPELYVATKVSSTCDNNE